MVVITRVVSYLLFKMVQWMHGSLLDGDVGNEFPAEVSMNPTRISTWRTLKGNLEYPSQCKLKYHGRQAAREPGSVLHPVLQTHCGRKYSAMLSLS